MKNKIIFILLIQFIFSAGCVAITEEFSGSLYELDIKPYNGQGWNVVNEAMVPLNEAVITDPFIEKILKIVPTENQLKWQKLDYYAFIHYSINTFHGNLKGLYTGKEWSGGSIPASKFNPSNQDTDQWARLVKASGMKGIIVTAKHHDGFVLFDSKFSPHPKGKEYSLKNAPYKSGNGDLVREVAESCKKYGLKFGFYYSPWDRNHPEYNEAPFSTYNDYFYNQITELCSNYGEVFEVWLDAAIGEEDAGNPHPYQWERIWNRIKELQPNAQIAFANDFRWGGNEEGKTFPNEWCIYHEGPLSDNIGSREKLKQYDDWKWYPAEFDLSNRRGWYYHQKETVTRYKMENNIWYGWTSGLKTPELLFDIYLKTVGGNANLLLNLAPDFTGVIHDYDIIQMQDLTKMIASIYDNPITTGDVRVDGDNILLSPALKDDDKSAVLNSDTTEITFYFDKQNLGWVILKEDLKFSQRVEKYSILIEKNGVYEKVYDGQTIGKRRIVDLRNIGETSSVKIIFEKSRNNPHISLIAMYQP